VIAKTEGWRGGVLTPFIRNLHFRLETMAGRKTLGAP